MISLVSTGHIFLLNQEKVFIKKITETFQLTWMQTSNCIQMDTS